MTGWLEMKIHAPKSFEIIVEHGEILQEGNLINSSVVVFGHKEVTF